MATKFRWSVTTHVAVSACPIAYRGSASVWVTARDPKRAERGLWERLPIAFSAPSPEEAERKARDWMTDMLAKARANHQGGKGRRGEFGVADELFEAMGALAEAMIENAAIRSDDPAADQMGLTLRDMPGPLDEDEDEI